MRRTILVLAVSALMAVMMAVAGVASAAPGGKSATAPNCKAGITKAQSSGKKSEKAKAALAKNLARCKG